MLVAGVDCGSGNTCDRYRVLPQKRRKSTKEGGASSWNQRLLGGDEKRCEERLSCAFPALDL